MEQTAAFLCLCVAGAMQKILLCTSTFRPRAVCCCWAGAMEVGEEWLLGTLLPITWKDLLWGLSDYA